MKLYGTPPTRAVRAIWLINEMGIDCEVVTVDMGVAEQSGPEMRKLNPAGKLPFLVDGGETISESCAIQMYLVDKFPEKGFLPDSLAERGQVYRWMFFLATEIEQPLWRIALHSRMYDDGERVAADIPLAERDCKKMVAVFEEHMKDREFVVGNRLSVVDFNAAFTLDWAREAGLLEDAPRLMAFVETMYARPTAPPTIAEAFAELRREMG